MVPIHREKISSTHYAASPADSIDHRTSELRLHICGKGLHTHNAIVGHRHRQHLSCSLLSGTPLVPHTENLATRQSGHPPGPDEWANPYTWSRPPQYGQFVVNAYIIPPVELRYGTEVTRTKGSTTNTYSQRAEALPLISVGPSWKHQRPLRSPRF